MKLIRRPWIWLLRVRNRKGYGVHSPAVYSFLRGVVYEDGAYYAYESLNRLHPWWVRSLSLYPLTCRRLLFRLANYVHPQRVMLVGDCPVETAYMHAAVPSAITEMVPLPTDSSPLHINVSATALLFLSHDALCRLSLPLSVLPSSLIIAEGIHGSAFARAKWKALQADSRIGATFDLYTYGLAFVGPPHAPRNYIVNF